MPFFLKITHSYLKQTFYTQLRAVQWQALRALLYFSLSTLLISAACNTALAGGCVRLEKGQQVYNLDGAISYHEDTSTRQTIQGILDNSTILWTPLREAVPSFGFSNSAYWLKFELCKSQPDTEKTVLEISYPLLDSIHLFGVANQAVTYEVSTGDTIPFSQRPEKHRNFLFNLPSTHPETLSIYLRIQTESAVQVPMRLYTSSGFFNHDQITLIVQGMYFGIILAMMLYNLFLFVSLRELPYLLYVLYTISFFSFQGVFQGFFQQYLFDSVWWQNHSLLLFGFISILFANLFASSFLGLSKNNTFIWRCLYGIGWIAVLAAVTASVLPYVIMVKVMLILACISSIMILVAGVKLWWKGHLPARIFTLAWSTLLVSFVLASLSKFGLLPRVFWTENIMQVGGIFEVVLLSIALGERINDEKRQRIQAEQSLSTSLEVMVQERTVALNHALAQLEDANSILDKMCLTDSLTHISNRRAFDTQIENEFKCARRGGYCLALIILDIDHFKKTNDTYGHQIGDQTLQSVAKTLSTCATRPRDSVFRYGGEEFAVLLNETPLSGALNVAERMRKLVEDSRLVFPGGTFSITISAGVCAYDPKDTDSPVGDPADLIRLADQQLYRSKSNGRNRVEPSAVTSTSSFKSDRLI